VGVRSAAVLALGQVPNPTSRRILRQAMSDTDGRVAANAVEAADAGGQLDAEALLPKLTSADNRVRANAVRALLKLGVREAAEALVRMLQHSDPRQRASGLWLVEKMGLGILAGRLGRMAIADVDLQVRTRAADVCERLRVPVSALHADRSCAVNSPIRATVPPAPDAAEKGAVAFEGGGI
jgi:HEAT repeat protein